MRTFIVIWFIVGSIIYEELYAKSFISGDFEYEIISNSRLKEITLVQYFGDDEFVEIPTYVQYNDQCYSVTIIGESAFIGNQIICDVVFPETLVEIGNSAFEGCDNLWVLNFPNSLTRIGKKAFKGLTNLDVLCLPNSELEVGDYAFENCEWLTFILIPEKVKHFGNYVFSNDLNIISAFCPGEQGFTTGWYSFDNINPQAVMYVPLYFMDNYSTLSMFPTLRSRTAPAICLNMLGVKCDIGDEFNIRAHAYAYPGATIESVVWESRNPSVVTVDQNGVVTAVGEGLTEVYCIVTDSNGESASANCSVRVVESSGIADVEIDASEMPAEYFTLQGLSAGTDRAALTPGIYIRRQGREATKIIIR